MDPADYDNRARVAALIAGLETEGQWPRPSGREARAGKPRPTAASGAVTARAEKPPRAQRREQEAVDDCVEVESLRKQLHIVVAYCNGSTQEEIARLQRMHVQTVRARLRDAGVHVTNVRTALSEADIDEIRSLHRRGQSARLLARRYGVAHTTILRYVR